jgi:hypothetical protein
MAPRCRFILTLLGLVLAAACCAPAANLPRRPPPARPPARAACPLGVEGTTVAVEYTADGVAVVFTSRGHVDELRERGRLAARLHGPFGRLGKGHDGRHGGGGHHGLQGSDFRSTHATAEDIEGGVRITLTPKYPEDLDVLRHRVEERAQRMSTAPCDV